MFRANLPGAARIGIVVLLCSLVSPLAFPGDKKCIDHNPNPPCKDLQACIRLIPATAAGSDSAPGRQELAEAINTYGGAAIPDLLIYLKDKDNKVSEVAAYTLRDQPGLREEHLPALIEARLRGDEWVLGAIARIGTPKAIAFLVSDFKKDSQPLSEQGWAFWVLGPKAGPPLVALYRCGTQCDERLLWSCAEIFGRLRDRAGAVVPELKAIALDRTQALIARRAAVMSLGNIGPSAVSVAPDLQTLAATEKADLGEDVYRALVGMRHPGAVPGLLNRIDKGDRMAFVDLSLLGPAGQGAAPSLVKYLNDPGRAVYAVRALWFVGYTEPSEPLVQMLRSEDWRAVYLASAFLGQIRASAARQELKRVMNTHWYPPVRDVARAALDNLDGKEGLEPESRRLGEFNFLALNFKQAGVLCRRERPKDEPSGASLNVRGGRLVGIENEYFGASDFYFVDDATKQKHPILRDNISQILQMGSRLLAVGGHKSRILANEEGTVYEIKRAGDDYSATVWRHLPGAPSGSKLQTDGRLLIYTDGGAVFLSEDGTMAMAPCSPPSD